MASIPGEQYLRSQAPENLGPAARTLLGISEPRRLRLRAGEADVMLAALDDYAEMWADAASDYRTEGRTEEAAEAGRRAALAEAMAERWRP